MGYREEGGKGERVLVRSLDDDVLEGQIET